MRAFETGAGPGTNSTTAFITGLTFTGSGLFSGSQTPITLDTGTRISEPSTLAMPGAGFAAAAWRRRRC